MSAHLDLTTVGMISSSWVIRSSGAVKFSTEFGESRFALLHVVRKCFSTHERDGQLKERDDGSSDQYRLLRGIRAMVTEGDETRQMEKVISIVKGEHEARVI